MKPTAIGLRNGSAHDRCSAPAMPRFTIRSVSKAGINIVLRALEAPIRQIAENSGVEGSIVVGKLLENKSQSYGFDAQTEQYVDMLNAGIVDPAKVVRVAVVGTLPPRPVINAGHMDRAVIGPSPGMLLQAAQDRPPSGCAGSSCR